VFSGDEFSDTFNQYTNIGCVGEVVSRVGLLGSYRETGNTITTAEGVTAHTLITTELCPASTPEICVTEDLPTYILYIDNNSDTLYKVGNNSNSIDFEAPYLRQQ